MTSPEPAALERWMDVARQLGFSSVLTPDDGFRQCVDQTRWPSESAGIYFWLTSNGEAYIGQSVVPRARLRQHMKVHGDIVQAAFRPCGRDELDRLEAELVTKAGEHFPLRNIKLAVSTASEVPFDAVVPPNEQQRFLAGTDIGLGEWRELDELKRLQQRKFERFTNEPWAQDALAALGLYLARAIPNPADTEVRFWSVSIRPQLQLLRVNVGQQEVFTVEKGWRGGLVCVFTADRIGWLRSWRSPYQTRSYVNFVSGRRLGSWLAGERLLSARRLIVQLMRHTQALNSASHCPQAVRAAFACGAAPLSCNPLHPGSSGPAESHPR